MSDDGIEARVVHYMNVTRPPSIRVGDETLVFPPGTTNEEAQSVLDEARRIYLKELSER
jgi:hypothetical protein